MVVVSGAEKVDDIRRSSLEQLSSLDAIIDVSMPHRETLYIAHNDAYIFCK